MKLFLGYHIWCRADMLAYLLSGIVENFDPDETELGFVIDNPLDGTNKAFDAMQDFWLVNRGYKFTPCAPGVTEPKPFKYTVFHPDKEVREVGGHNILLKHFVEHTDCDVMVAPQDDIRFNRPVHQALQTVLDTYGPDLGVIGSRDGYFYDYKDIAGSFWSKSFPGPTTRLQHGEFVERPFMNSGPVSYPRHIVEKVGYLDELFIAWNVWDDYGVRCLMAKLRSVVLGLDCTHCSFGRVQHSWFYDSGGGYEFKHKSEDYLRFRMKHG